MFVPSVVVRSRCGSLSAFSRCAGFWLNHRVAGVVSLEIFVERRRRNPGLQSRVRVHRNCDITVSVNFVVDRRLRSWLQICVRRSTISAISFCNFFVPIHTIVVLGPGTRTQSLTDGVFSPLPFLVAFPLLPLPLPFLSLISPTLRSKAP